ncbi:MAG: hypothetical protein M0P49_02270 [Bacilli bacterium]|jgi:hypothetical protein|nr:hypothetical protein [Bacilli bacterium]
MMVCKYAILIDCPDEYLDILHVFFLYLEKNWRDCPATIYITTNEKEIDHPNNVVFVKCGFNINSIQRSKIAINTINENFLLILDCDCLFRKKINSNIINLLVDYLDKVDAKYCRLWKNPCSYLYKTSFKHLYHLNSKQRYSMSLMANIWKKEVYLNEVASLNLDGWSIENEWLKESFYSKKGKKNGYYYFSEDPLHILHAVYKGKWIRKAYCKMISDCVSPSCLESRECILRRTEIKIDFSRFIKKIFPSSLVRLTKKILSFFGVKFSSRY